MSASVHTDPFRLDERVVYLAGAGSFGRAVGPVLAQRGARVFVVDLDPVAVEDLVASIRSAGGEAEGQPADLGEAGAVGRTFEALDGVFGRVDIVPNLSGGNPRIGKQIAAAMPDARLVIIPGAGHNPMWEKQADFDREVLAFLRAEPQAMV